MVDAITDETLKRVIAICNQGFASHDPQYYDRIDDLLSTLDQSRAIQKMRRFAQVGPTLSSKRFAYPHIADTASEVISAMNILNAKA